MSRSFRSLVLSLGLLLVLATACTRTNPDYNGQADCQPACRLGERCVQARCIPNELPDAGPKVDAPIRPDVSGVDLPPRTDRPFQHDLSQNKDAPILPGDDVKPPEDMGKDLPIITICIPGQPTCANDHVEGICDDFGTQVVDTRQCADTEVCQDGFCQGTGTFCTPGESECNGSLQVKRCNDSGTDFDVIDCAPNFTCSHLGGPANCYRDRNCTPGGTYACFGQAQFLVHCVDTGQYIEEIADCIAQNSSCTVDPTSGTTCCLSNSGTTSLCCFDGGGCQSF